MVRNARYVTNRIGGLYSFELLIELPEDGRACLTLVWFASVGVFSALVADLLSRRCFLPISSPLAGRSKLIL